MVSVLPALVALLVGALATEDLLSGSRVSAIVIGFQVCAFLINLSSLAADLGSLAFLFHLRDPSPASPFHPRCWSFPLATRDSAGVEAVLG
jgi:hypothetical protein